MLRTTILAVCLVGTIQTAATAQPALSPPIASLRIVAPAAPGGGWDQTARAMRQALLDVHLVDTVTVENVAGAAGTIGLARFVKGVRRDEPALLVTGLVMQGAIVANQAPVSLGRVTPIARLTGEYEVIVVPAASPLRTLADLVEAFRTNPASISWAGGSAGGTDQLFVGLLARSAGIAPARINYIAFSGGGEALGALLGNQVSAGIAGYGEFAPHIASGALRALAISSPARVNGTAIPTLVEQGYDVVLSNWRGVVGPSRATPELRTELGRLVARLHDSPSWRAALERFGWTDLYLPAEPFDAFLRQEESRIESIVLSLRSGTDIGPLARGGGRLFPALIGAGLVLITAALAVDARRRRVEKLPHNPSTASLSGVAWIALGAILTLSLLERVGFVAASTLLFALTARGFGSTRWIRNVAIGLAFALAVYLIFTRGLSLSLPSGLLQDPL
jgi:putative tricarboxylic transport membrane protein